MKKGIVCVVLALAFAVTTASVGMAANVKCTVDSIDGDTVIMTCKGADSLKAGDSVTVKAKKSGGAAVEGC